MRFSFPGGLRRTLTIGATAGNVVTDLTPGADRRWLVLRGVITVVTDATVANRYFAMRLTDGTNIIEYLAVVAAHTASLTKRHSFGEARDGSVSATLGHEGLAAAPEMYLPMQPIILQGADELEIYVAAGVAGDSYSGYVVVLEVVA